jgi:hypothetical protein
MADVVLISAALGLDDDNWNLSPVLVCEDGAMRQTDVGELSANLGGRSVAPKSIR